MVSSVDDDEDDEDADADANDDEEDEDAEELNKTSSASGRLVVCKTILEDIYY